MTEVQTGYLMEQMQKRQMPTGKIRKPTKGIDGLPLFDPKVKHEAQQEKAQGGLFAAKKTDYTFTCTYCTPPTTLTIAVDESKHVGPMVIENCIVCGDAHPLTKK